MSKGQSFTWINFYKELAKKLLEYRNNRKAILDFIYSNREEFMANYLHDSDDKDDLCKDIDPFTVFGLFNRTISDKKRMNTLKEFKKFFSLSSDVPSDFDGIPVLQAFKSMFFGFKSSRKDDDIENLWCLFENAILDKDIENDFNKVKSQFGININCTMGLFWICPDKYLSFDGKNKKYLKDTYSIDIPGYAPDYKEYIKLVNDMKSKMASNKIKEKTFYELSANANDYIMSNGGDSESNGDKYEYTVSVWKRMKNIVLYGAPGTGKTYDVPMLIVCLCDPDFYNSHKDRKDIVERYNQLKQEKRVAFTTFHQSMDYEDWIEGLKPVVDNGQITYEIENGLFKQFCEDAERPIVKDKETGISDDAVVWKVSLSGAGDNPVRKECMKNGHIRIGWDDYGADISDQTDWSVYHGEGKQILDAFINKMKVGDIVMSCYSNRTIDAIGVVTGEYEYVDTYKTMKRVRKVNWLVKGIDENIVEMNDGKTMTLGTVYRLNSISLDNVKSLLDKYKKTTGLEENTMPYVMVIDEMNRGNVSKIFGELITLLEADKRKGRKNQESVRLPYSKKSFVVPDNVYIIATMNTADRSLGTLDYAIRRRFAFFVSKPSILKEIGFNEELFRKVSELFISNYDEYEESDCFQDLKIERAETLADEFKPEEVWIGHSYFLMNDDDGNDITAERLLYEIIPLLEEYVRDGILTQEAMKTINELYDMALQ